MEMIPFLGVNFFGHVGLEGHSFLVYENEKFALFCGRETNLDTHNSCAVYDIFQLKNWFIFSKKKKSGSQYL